MKMVFLHFLIVSLLLCSTADCQEPLELLALQPPSAVRPPPAAAVHVEPQYLKDVSESVLAAENWVRNHVLVHYPATNITTVVVGSTVFCNLHHQQSFGLILPSIKNIHHSLTRWGLHHDIKVSAAFSSDCLDPLFESYRADLAQTYIKPLLTFLKGVASPYVVKPPRDFLASPEEISVLRISHSKSMKNLGISESSAMNVIVGNGRRKLSSIDISNSRVNPFPPRPTPNPAFPSGSPLPPLIGSLPPEPSYQVPTSPPFLPHLAPVSSPPYGPHLPPCNPPRVRHEHGTWCVAKPSVPAETLQEALDYACGDGNVDCEAIKENGSCFYPDNLVAHASYAFNSYWQTTKRNGGSCGFGGTAMLITSDPSYGHCRFTLT